MQFFLRHISFKFRRPIRNHNNGSWYKELLEKSKWLQACVIKIKFFLFLKDFVDRLSYILEIPNKYLIEHDRRKLQIPFTEWVGENLEIPLLLII